MTKALTKVAAVKVERGRLTEYSYLIELDGDKERGERLMVHNILFGSFNIWRYHSWRENVRMIRYKAKINYVLFRFGLVPVSSVSHNAPYIYPN